MIDGYLPWMHPEVVTNDIASYINTPQNPRWLDDVPSVDFSSISFKRLLGQQSIHKTMLTITNHRQYLIDFRGRNT